MPTLTEDIALPGGVAPSSVKVDIQLVGTGGVAVQGFEQGTAKTIAGTASTTGATWSIASIVGNTDIDLPTGTVYKVTRSWPGLLEPLVDYISMPSAGGPYRVDQVLTSTPVPVPSAATNEVAYAEITSDSSALAVTGLTAVAVPLLTVTVPDLTRPVYLHGRLRLICSSANASVFVAFAPPGGTLTDCRGPYWANIGPNASSSQATCAPCHRLPAHSPGTWQAFVGGDNSFNITVKAAAAGLSWVMAESA